MHELSIAQAIVDVAARHAAGRRVERVQVRIGHLRQVVPSALAFSFRPRGLKRITSRPTSTDLPARPMVEAKAWTAFDLRTECEPMNAIFALRCQGTPQA